MYVAFCGVEVPPGLAAVVFSLPSMLRGPTMPPSMSDISLVVFGPLDEGREFGSSSGSTCSCPGTCWGLALTGTRSIDLSVLLLEVECNVSGS